MSDIFSASVSAMNAAQIGLSTTEHNIANANTAGYTRQSIVQTATAAQLTGAGYLGTGVNVGTIQRAYNQFLTEQVNQQQTVSSQLNTQYSQIQQIDNMLSSSTSGVSPALQSFFNAVNTVAGAPDSLPARQTMLDSAQSLTSTFNSLSQQLTSINTSVNNQISSSVTTINSYAQQIATLNNNIMNAQAVSGGQPPNDLLDQRDQLVAQLNQQINTTVVDQGNGGIEVTVGNGQLLVLSGKSYNLTTVNSASNPSQPEVGFTTSSGTLTPFPANSIQSGILGGLLAFQSQNLVPAQNQLGLVAAGVAGTFNQQNQLGQDLNGNMPTSGFFTNITPAVIVNSANTGTVASTAITPTITDYSKLTGNDYSLSYDGTNYTLTNTSNNQIVSTVAAAAVAGVGSAATIPPPPATNVDGLTINIPAGAKAGDSFLIRPTANAAANISVAITDPAQIAAAAPVMTNAPSANTGTGTISPGVVDATFTPATQAALATPVTLTYNAGTFTVSQGGVSAPLPVTVTAGSPPTTTSYAAGTPVPYTDGATINYGGASFTISGTPANNDTFTLAQNTSGSTDNRNALLLAGLQTKNTMQGGTNNYVGVYSELVAQVGNQTSQLKVTSTAQTTMLNQTIASQQSVSGVNLDEEAANLLRYQQAYQAAGKAMQIASTLFDTLLSIGK